MNKGNGRPAGGAPIRYTDSVNRKRPMFDPEDDLLYDAAWEDREERIRRQSLLWDEDGEECLTAAERNPSM